MITYENQNDRKIGKRRGWDIDVRLDGKRVGTIVSTTKGYAYLPNGKRSAAGLYFDTLAACKLSLQAE